MRTSPISPRWSGVAVATLVLALTDLARAANSPIPFSEIGARATADYQGEALSITATPDGARLHCRFQQLDGRATPQGLWLESTVPGGGRFRLTAAALCRESSRARERALIEPSPWEPRAPTDRRVAQVVSMVGPPRRGGPEDAIAPEIQSFSRPKAARSASGPYLTGTQLSWATRPDAGGYRALAATGRVEVADKLVRFTRAGVTEEYSVSVDGVRQDFVIPERPVGAGDLRVELALSGARAEAAAYGAKLILEGSGRALAYSRLRAIDATGLELKVRLEVVAGGRLAVQVADAAAIYPVRIDPTFSDANWVSLNPGMPGADSEMWAIAVDASGNVYVGGDFIVIGTVVANYIAKWNGSAWSALGGGMDSDVYALAVSGTNLYAGGDFTNADSVTVNFIAAWNGSAWSALGKGMDSDVYALAVSGSSLYVGGDFANAGTVSASYIAKWSGSAWSALGKGMDSDVYALALSGSTLYAGGDFIQAGTVSATNIAKWNGSAWSALGKGMDSDVYALAVSGSTLYAGGDFIQAGGVSANYIAAWNGSAWSALGGGMDSDVYALAVSGSTLYAGGDFTNANSVTVNHIAAWNGNAWSALSAGMNGDVHALAVSGTNLYAGGGFAAASGLTPNYIAAWNGSGWTALGAGMNSDVLCTGGEREYSLRRG